MSENLKILITGAKGQLGNELKILGKGYPAIQFTFTDVEELDITSMEAVSAFMDVLHPDVVVNCAAYTAVDKAEQEPDLALKINALAVRNLSNACGEFNALLIHISTDYIFSGKGFRPYVETDTPAPASSYAKSKYAGETQMLSSCKNGIILRTSWLYSAFGNNFVKTILKYGKERGSLNVVFDQIGCPTYAKDLAVAILDIIPQVTEHEGIEIFHYANEGVASWYDFAKAIIDFSGIKCLINPIETRDYPLPAERPFYSVLNKAKFKERFGLAIPYWKDSLGECINRLNGEIR
ncbi:MAG: dTDP-4-dehydrorhamnose reductase [Bacteroidetes bacterium]|nr:dTDP-4-dehydrorhamnose reductase [Bacteroidota bacterium]